MNTEWGLRTSWVSLTTPGTVPGMFGKLPSSLHCVPGGAAWCRVDMRMLACIRSSLHCVPGGATECSSTRDAPDHANVSKYPFGGLMVRLS